MVMFSPRRRRLASFTIGYLTLQSKICFKILKKKLKVSLAGTTEKKTGFVCLSDRLECGIFRLSRRAMGKRGCERWAVTTFPVSNFFLGLSFANGKRDDEERGTQ